MMPFRNLFVYKLNADPMYLDPLSFSFFYIRFFFQNPNIKAVIRAPIKIASK
jgi:hypothetical protein